MNKWYRNHPLLYCIHLVWTTNWFIIALAINAWAIYSRRKKERIMEGMLTNISKFYDKYTCPICLFTKVARIPRNKITYEIAYKNGEVLCLDYPFWNATSIWSFISLFSIVYTKTRFSFAFPTHHKCPLLVTVTWLINFFPEDKDLVFRISNFDEGGELGRMRNCLHIIAMHLCVFLRTGKSSSLLNGMVENPNSTIINYGSTVHVITEICTSLDAMCTLSKLMSHIRS